jgi:hypothetical protein
VSLVVINFCRIRDPIVASVYVGLRPSHPLGSASSNRALVFVHSRRDHGLLASKTKPVLVAGEEGIGIDPQLRTHLPEKL